MLRNNKLNLLISIVCAIVLWAYITTVVNPTTERTIGNIPVELINIEALNDRGFTVPERVPYFVDVVVSGARSEVAKLQESDFKATADMTGYRKGVQSVPVYILMPTDFELIQVRPETVQVEVVELITVFKPVRLEYEEVFGPNQEPGFISIIPEEMEVSGVAAAVDSVDYIRAFVSSGLLTEEMDTFRLEVEAIGKDGQVVYNVGLSQNSVEVTGMLCYTKRVDLNVEMIGEPNESIEVTDLYIPGVVYIRGTEAEIEGITEIEGRPVDLSAITTSEEIPLESILRLPETIELAEASKNLSVRIEVQGIARKEFRFTADQIEIENLYPSLSAHVNTGSVIVTVFATKNVLAEIRQEHIKLFVDASDYYRAGSAIEMEVLAECEIEVKDIEVEPKKVRVTIIRE